MTTLHAPPAYSTMSAADAVQHVREHGATSVIDVRTPFETSQESLDGSHRCPLEALASHLDEIRKIQGPKLILCRSGKRAATAGEELALAGIRDVVVIEGGILAYSGAGGQTKRGAQRMSLERQVRIAAGSFAALGAVLGFAIHPGFHGLSAFVGCGLIFAGITDWCGMGLLLARMPWNRVTA